MIYYNSVDEAINALILTAKLEVGYMEKKSDSNLYDKTANAGSNNYIVYVHIVPKEISGYNWDKYYVGITSQTPKKRWVKMELIIVDHIFIMLFKNMDGRI